MPCPNKKKNEIVVCNTLFQYDLVPVNEDTTELICTPCNLPTAVYDIARISIRENSCNQIQYYQSFINTDPVVIIQDCNLECIIRRSIETYFENMESINCNCCNNNLGFSLF